MKEQASQQFLLPLMIAFIAIGIIAGGYLWLRPVSTQMAPELNMKMLTSGKPIRLQDYRGRPVLVTFWATTCRSCVKELPNLIALHKELAGQGLEIIGIAMSYDRPDYVLEMQKHKQIPYPVVWDGINEASRAFGGVRYTPTSFLINPEGQIVSKKIGELNMERLHAQITDMLNRRGG